MDFQPVDHYAQGKGYWEQSQGWASWLEWPAAWHTLDCYRKGRVWAQTMRDGKNHDWYTEFGGAGWMGVAEGIFDTALQQRGGSLRGAQQSKHQIAQAILTARRITQFGVQSTRVADAFSQWQSAALFRRVQTGDADASRPVSGDSAWSPSISIWIEGVVSPIQDHLLELLVSTVNLVVELFELWMCWLDIEDARHMKEGTVLAEYAFYLAPIHLFEAGDNIQQMVDWGANREAVQDLRAEVNRRTSSHA